jgi:hypothetical protein
MAGVASGVKLQPHSPMPKLAVKRIQKATMPIIHRSSGFIVRILLPWIYNLQSKFWAIRIATGSVIRPL